MSQKSSSQIEESSPQSSICDKCRLKGDLVGSSGDYRSEVMVVGGSSIDSPKLEVDTLFSGIAKQLNLAFNYYYTTAIKCCVSNKPTLSDIKMCNGYLKDQISIIKPKYVLVMGETAFKALLWDFDLITKNKPDIDGCAGSHIYKNGVCYFITQNIIEAHGTIRHNVATFIKVVNGSIKIKPVKYKEIDSEKDLIYLLNEAERTGKISVDIETNSLIPFVKDFEIFSIGFSVKEAEGYCAFVSFPHNIYFDHWGYKPKLNVLLVLHYLNKILTNPHIRKIFHNAQYDVLCIETVLGYTIQNFECTMIQKYLMNQDEKERLGLKHLLKEFTDMGAYEYAIKQYVGSTKKYVHIPPRIMCEYNCGDVDGTLRLFNIFPQQLARMKLDKKYFEFMLPKARDLIEMQKVGVKLNLEGCIKLKNKHEKELVGLYSSLKTLPQVVNFEKIMLREFKPRSIKDMFAMVYGGELTTNEEIPRPIVNGKKKGKKEFKKAYINEFNLTPILVPYKNPKTNKTEDRKSFGQKAIQKYLKGIYKDVKYLDAINTFQLDELPSNTDIMKFIRLTTKISSIETQLSNHINKFIDVWGNTKYGRVHCSYGLTSTGTGRLNAKNPNLQNLKRDGFVKEAFISRWGDDGVLVEADYKQLELFIMAILSQDKKFVHAFMNNIDLHLKTASEVIFRCPIDKVTKQMRTMAKSVNFGMIYGKTAYSLCDDLNMTEGEAQVVLEAYFREYPGVYRYCKDVKLFARNHGYVDTVTGRRRYIDYKWANAADRKAVNTTIQSPANDVCLISLGKTRAYFDSLKESVDKDGVAVVCGNVHDSLWFDVKKKYINEAIPAIKLLMENTGEPWVTIPLKVDIKYGPNFKEMTEWEQGKDIKF